MDSNDIKQLIVELLQRMQVSFEGIDISESDGRERFSINTPDSHLLIGARGANLLAFNHLVRKIAAAKSASSSNNEPEKVFFVDVNGYQEAALASIKTVAKMMGDRARSFKSSVELDPMSSYERMIVHSFFQEAKDLKTESVGEGEQRRVVIKYTGE